MLPIPRRTKARLDKWIRNGRVLQAGVCVKPHVACAVRSVRRAHEAGYGRAEHMCSCGEPFEMWGLLWDVQSDVMAAARASRTSSLLDGTIQQGFTLLPDSNHTCSHDATLRI